MTSKPTPRAPSVVTPPWMVHVDPAVRRGHPAVTVVSDTDTTPLAFLVSALPPPDADGGDSRELDSGQFDARPSFRYRMPSVTEDTYASLNLSPMTPADADPVLVWNTLLRPKGKAMLDYRGRAEMLPPDDFDAYWERAQKELDAVPFAPTVTPVPEKDTKTGFLFRVELPTVRETTIVCWYYVPRTAFAADGTAVRRFPAIVIMPGYGAEEPPLDRTDKGLITLSVNPRSHGPSREYWTSPVEHMLYNLDDPENYYYKLAFLDCLQGARFVFSRLEVDTDHVAAEGGSQGGLFAIALAALEPRIACVCSNVTAFSDYPDGMALARIGHHTSFRKQLKEASLEEAERIRLSLRYTDGANLVTRVHSPIQINMGGQDPVCPYVCGIVVYSRVPAGVRKEYHIVADAKHEVPPPMRENNMRWYRRWLGLAEAARK